VEVVCPGCGADLRVNPNLAGMRISCPQCGAAVTPPAQEKRRTAPKRRRTAEPDPAATPAPSRRPFSYWQLASQVTIALLGIACLAGAFFRGGWQKPEWSFFMEDPLWLAGAGTGLLLLCFLGSRLPLIASMVTSIFVLVAGGYYYSRTGEVEVSRVLALSVAMLALWFALQHRRAIS
jgi:ribosomal protein S27E